MFYSFKHYDATNFWVNKIYLAGVVCDQLLLETKLSEYQNK